MKLIVGLGNPGSEYEFSRHNLGFMAVNELLKYFNARLRNDAANKCLKAILNFKAVDFILCKPLTWMNLSGQAVKNIVLKNKITSRDILVICDDVHLEAGEIKIKAEGSSGGHNGLASIIESLGTRDFNRLRIGVAGPGNSGELSDYVLSDFKSGEYKIIQGALTRARETVLCWLEKGIDATMNRFN